MRPLVFILLALSLISNATLINHHQRRSAHLITAHRVSSLTSREVEKRCKPRSHPEKVQPTTSTESSKPSPSSSSQAKDDSKDSNNNNNNDNNSGSGSTVGLVSGLLHASSNCGASGATKKITAKSGPNGDIDFLNCGISGGGWQPPYVKIEQLIVADLDSAMADNDTPFKACRPYIDIFKSAGAQYNIPSIILSSFAMQESSCNPNTVGGAGEQGLMQITKDKCGDAPNDDCKEPWYNIFTAAKYFSEQLKNNGYNVIKTVGQYNGWKTGMTYNDATAARYGGCCRCQNNLDYLHQFFNGWCQNKNAYDLKLGVFFNLNVC